MVLVLGFLMASGWGMESAHAFTLPVGAEQIDFLSLQPSRDFRTDVDFTAIVALSNCSGSLIRFESSLGTDQAMVLTNGHCLDLPGNQFLKPGEVRVNQPVSRSFKLLTPNGRSVLGILNADLVMYATMTDTDITLYRVKQTYDEIEKKYGTSALKLSSRHPSESTRIAIASGYWKKIYSCSIDQFIYNLRESDWTFVDSIRYLQPGCETIGGTSGSPIIDADTHEVIGINNTGNENGERCTMDNPCEVDKDGKITVIKKASYGQQTYWITGCVNSKNEIDLAKQGCSLPKPHSIH